MGMIRTQLHRSVVILSVLSLVVSAVFFSGSVMAMGMNAGAAVQGTLIQMDAAPTKMPMREPCPRILMAPCCVGICGGCSQLVGLPDASAGLGTLFPNCRVAVSRHDRPSGISAIPDPSPPRTSSIA